MWLFSAVLSSLFAGATSILAKCGIKKADSDCATAIRTGVVLLFSWIMTFITGEYAGLRELGARNLLFLALSGIATGASWICYFKALSMGDVNKVVPIDKSSTVLSIALAIIIFHETEALAVKLLGGAVLAVGIALMVERRDWQGESRRGWLIYAVLSAVFAALTGVLAKLGIDGVPSNLATAVRTGFVLIMAWAVVFLRGKGGQVKLILRRELMFICLSGIATGASWLCYYYALQNGQMSVVVPIDKLSILVTVVFSYLVFGEKLTCRSSLGLALMTGGTLAMAIWS